MVSILFHVWALHFIYVSSKSDLFEPHSSKLCPVVAYMFEGLKVQK